MRVLHIIPGLQIGGAEIFLESLINAWPRNNDEHVVACFHGGVIADRLRAKNICVHEFMPRKTYSPVAVVRAIRNLSAWIDEFKPDVVLSSLWSANILARSLCYIKRIPLISVWHNNAQYLTFFKRYLDAATAVFFLGRCVAVSPSVFDSYADLPFFGAAIRKKLVVVENGVNVSELLDGKDRHGLRQKFHLTPGRFVFGAVGRLIPVKAFSNLILAFQAFLQGEISTCEDMMASPMLCIVGDGPEFDALQGLIDRLDLSSSVVLCGQQDDVASLYHGFSAYVSSSMSEGLSVALLEALAVGLPFVVTRAAEPSGLFRADVDGIVVDSHEVVDLALGLVKMYDEYDKYAKHAESRTLLVRRFYSITRTAELYVSLLENISEI